MTTSLEERTRATPTKTYTATEARNNFSEIINEAIYKGPVFVKRNKKQKVAIISEELFRILTELEALLDSGDAKEAFEEFLKRGGVTLDQIEEELGVD